MTLDDLPMTTRTKNCLENVGVKTMKGLLACSEEDLLAIPNFGRKSLAEVKEDLGNLGLSLSPTGHPRDAWRRRCWPHIYSPRDQKADLDFIHQDRT